jgi:hypothetical protein
MQMFYQDYTLTYLIWGFLTVSYSYWHVSLSQKHMGLSCLTVISVRRSWSSWYIFCHGQCSFVEHRNYKIVYRRYASLFFLVGVDDGEVIHFFYISCSNCFIQKRWIIWKEQHSMGCLEKRRGFSVVNWETWSY